MNTKDVKGMEISYHSTLIMITVPYDDMRKFFSEEQIRKEIQDVVDFEREKRENANKLSRQKL